MASFLVILSAANSMLLEASNSNWLTRFWYIIPFCFAPNKYRIHSHYQYLNLFVFFEFWLQNRIQSAHADCIQCKIHKSKYLSNGRVRSVCYFEILLIYLSKLFHTELILSISWIGLSDSLFISKNIHLFIYIFWNLVFWSGCYTNI